MALRSRSNDLGLMNPSLLTALRSRSDGPSRYRCAGHREPIKVVPWPSNGQNTISLPAWARWRRRPVATVGSTPAQPRPMPRCPNTQISGCYTQRKARRHDEEEPYRPIVLQRDPAHDIVWIRGGKTDTTRNSKGSGYLRLARSMLHVG
jgi:hypothetical protein